MRTAFNHETAVNAEMPRRKDATPGARTAMSGSPSSPDNPLCCLRYRLFRSLHPALLAAAGAALQLHAAPAGVELSFDPGSELDADVAVIGTGLDKSFPLFLQS